MMTLTFAFWLFVLLFAVIGAMRGWAKELLVTFSVILALFILNVLGRYVPPFRDFLGASGGTTSFWLRSVVVILLVFFGYQTPNIQKIAGARFARERLSDMLLGLVMGAINGFIIIGTLWFFMDETNYPFPIYISAPDPANPMSEPALKLLPFLAPHWLGIPQIYFAIAVAFLFVIVVFI